MSDLTEVTLEVIASNLSLVFFFFFFFNIYLAALGHRHSV